MKIPTLALATLFALLAQKSSAILTGNIVSNGDFEIIVGGATFPGWQFSGGYSAFVNEPSQAASGNNCIFVGGEMWQDLSTVIGQTYQFSFYQRGDDPGQTQRYSLLNVSWGGQSVGSFTNSNWDRTWYLETFDVVATSTTTRI